MPKSPEATGSRVRRAPRRLAAVVAGAAAVSPVVLAPGTYIQKAQGAQEITLDREVGASRGARQIMLGKNVVALTSFVAPKSQAAVAPKSQPVPRQETYPVEQGDSPWSIAKHFDPHANPKNFIIFLDKFLRDNHLNPAWTPIHAGQIVKVPTATEPPAPNVPLEPPQSVVTVNHAAPSNTAHTVYHSNYTNSESSTPAPTTYTGNYGNADSSVEQCVIERESGGDPTASNSEFGASGLYGFLPSTWHQVTGLSGNAGNYSVEIQHQAFEKLYAEDGVQPWAPSDGC